MEALRTTKSPDMRVQKVLEDRGFAEFFAGIGLMRLGLECAGWQVRFANDICKDKYAMYATNFPDAPKHFSLGDIHSLNPSEIPTVTLATASFPCNDLSLAGMRNGLAGRQSSAYWGFIDILKRLEKRRPPLVLLENVAGFLTSKNGEDFLAALQALNQLGYCVDAFILDAARFVPQSRVRLFVVGSVKQHMQCYTVNETSGFYESILRPKSLAEFILMHPEINWNLRKLPDPPKCNKNIEIILEDVNAASLLWWNQERTDYLIKQMSPRHVSVLKQMMKHKKWSYGTVFRRVRNNKSMAELRYDGIAGCLRTPRGGSGRQILVQAGFGQVKVRLLSPLECARLMGADDYKIDATPNKALFGFGDAVCVPAVAWIANNYLNPLVEELL
jgi:DNA (cytosine-5)-methyltransferase 1